jgi:hypothetical protein
MNAADDRTHDVQGQSVVTELATRVALIFEEYPILCGFSVQEHSMLSSECPIVQLQGGLCIADVTVNTPPSRVAARELCNHIACALLELMDDQPAVFELLPGRTFARTLH